MAILKNTPADVAASVERFKKQGYLVLPGALDSHQVAALNRAIDDYIVQHPQEWVALSDSLCQTVDVLPRTDAFDFAIENPRTLDMLRGILGEDLALEEFSIMLRNPTPNLNEFKGWHRDIIRDFDRRMEIDAVSLVYYLTDVGPNDHCLSVIPETHAGRVDMRPGDVQAGEEVDLLGPAGTAVFFHARCIHTGKLKAGSRTRRTLHIYYGPADRPRTSEWTQIPARLAEKRAPQLPGRLYSKWNLAEVIDGTGRKPRDVPPGLSTVELLRIVQTRAKARG